MSTRCSECDLIGEHRWWCSYRCRPMSEEEVRELVEAAHEAKASRAEDMPTTDDALQAMHRAFLRLTELDWNWMPSGRAKRLASCWGNVEVVTAGSTGIFPAQCDDKGRWWVEDGGEVWPARPILWRETARSEAESIDD